MSAKIAGKLFIQRRFAPLFVLLQAGTFNDNTLKNALISLITFGGVAFLSDLNSAIRVPVAAFIFTGPFLLICAIAGQLADKYDRGKILRWVKRFEIVIMLIAALGFYLENIYILALALGLMGAQSGFFSPTKNAVLPQWLADKELITGNALLNGFVFVFVLVGTIVGTLVVLQPGGPQILSMLMVGLAILGWLAAEQAPPAPPPAPDLKVNFEPISASWSVLAKAFDAPAVLRPMLGIAWFYGLSTVLITTFPDYIKARMNFDQGVLSFILVLSTVSILVGSLLTVLIARLKIWGPEAIRLSAFGICGVTAFTVALYLLPSPVHGGEKLGTLNDLFAHPHTFAFLAVLTGSSICGAFFIVPLQAMAQRRADPKRRAQLMSAGAVWLNLFVNVITFGLIGLAAIGIVGKAPFLIIIVGSAIVSVYAVYRSLRPAERPSFMQD